MPDTRSTDGTRDTVGVACIQMSSGALTAKEERLQRALSMIRALPEVDLILLPELWPVGYFDFARYADDSEPLCGPIYEATAEIARERSAFVLGGSIVERANDGRLFNTSFLVGPDGALAHVYRKVHVFGYHSEESKHLTPGTGVGVAPTPLGVIGVSTCYDLRFPELYRLMVDQGVEIILIPSAWPWARLAHWELLTRARALENQSFVVACNAAGEDHGTSLGGNSVIVDPWGEVVTTAGDSEEVLIGTLNMRLLRKIRNDFPALADRRIRTTDPLWVEGGDDG